MEKRMIEKLASVRKIDLKQYTHVITTFNENLTKMFVTFANQQGTGVSKVYVDENSFTMSISAMYKRGESQWDYETNGWQSIWW